MRKYLRWNVIVLMHNDYKNQEEKLHINYGFYNICKPINRIPNPAKRTGKY